MYYVQVSILRNMTEKFDMHRFSAFHAIVQLKKAGSNESQQPSISLQIHTDSCLCCIKLVSTHNWPWQRTTRKVSKTLIANLQPNYRLLPRMAMTSGPYLGIMDEFMSRLTEVCLKYLSGVKANTNHSFHIYIYIYHLTVNDPQVQPSCQKPFQSIFTSFLFDFICL